MTELTLELQETNHKLDECRAQKDAADQRITEMAQELENSAGRMTSAQVYHDTGCCTYKVLLSSQLCSRCTTQSCCQKRMRLQDLKLLFKASPPTNEMHFNKHRGLLTDDAQVTAHLAMTCHQQQFGGQLQSCQHYGQKLIPML